MTPEERMARQREYRKKNNNACTFRYEKTRKGKLVRTYRNMQSRVLGILKKKAHLYTNPDILPKEDFYQWSLSDPTYNELFDEWVKSGYSKKLSPSIDRLDTSMGYTLNNIRWVTHSENSRLGAVSRKRK